MEFDAAYYDRFYRDPETRAASDAEQRTQAVFIASYLRYLDVNIDSILDLGCGLGTLHRQLQQSLQAAKVTGVDVSEYLCETYGWEQGSVVNFKCSPHDLVICSDVLGYLSDGDCNKAINNLAKRCASALYLSVLTEEDLEICDKQHTDMRQHARPYTWYRERLDKHFTGVGGGLFLRKPLQVAVWRLERI